MYRDQTNIATVIVDDELVDTLCNECAERIYKDIEGAEIEVRYTWENNDADAPEHCNQCGVLLEWNMTEDGLEYIAQEIREHLGKYGYLSDDLTAWHDAYGEYVAEYLKREYPDVDLDDILDVDDVLSAYVAALVWTGTLDYMTGTYEHGGEPLTTGSLDEIGYEPTAEVIAHSREDVEPFVLNDVAQYLFYFLPILDAHREFTAEQLGLDFHLTRNRHGAGFWDRGLGELGSWLTEVSHPYNGHYLMGRVLLLDPRSDSIDQSNLDLESVSVVEGC